jgi:hypothetical protein
MTQLHVKIPDSLMRQVRVLARRDEISVDQFIATAVAEKMAAMQTAELLKRRAKRGSRKKFDAALALVPDAPARAGDRID